MPLKRMLHIAQANGGVEHYIQLYMKYDSEFEHILVCSQDYQQKAFVGFTFESIHMERAIQPLKDIKAIWQVRKLIKKYQPDIVYTHSSKGGAIGRLAAVGLHKLVVYNPHGWPFQMRISNKKRYVYQILERLLSHLCYGIIVISESEKQAALQRKICDERKLHLVYNGIETHVSIEPMKRESFSIPSDAFVIGCVARIAEGKSPLLFVEVAKVLKKQYANAFFIWVGDGPLKDEMIALIQKFELQDCFLITGWVDEPLAYISMFDIAILLTRWEGFGYALCEYMLLHKPIISTKIDAVLELMEDGKTGILVPPDDIAKIVEAVACLSNKEVATEMSEKAYKKVVKTFTIEDTVAKLNAVFHKFLSEKNG